MLNNVNASADSLTPPYLRKVAALADVFRPYGVQGVSLRPLQRADEIGGLETADPLDPRVQAWWRAKADEIYALIPDFGGFLVKANSEGQPGPQDYGRSHAEGANMFADALAPAWRHRHVARVRLLDGQPEDRAKQAYDEFMPLDGKFRDNVILQVKNGPIDFQPREPFHPLFGAMPQTPLMMECRSPRSTWVRDPPRVSGPAVRGGARSDTCGQGPGSTVAQGDRRLARTAQPLTGMAGVANIGADRNWTGSHLRPGQLVCVRPSGLGSRPRRRGRSRKNGCA